MPKRILLFFALVLSLAFISLAQAAPAAFDLTLCQGEKADIPAGRLGPWTSTDESVALVRDGAIYGIAPGRAVISLTGSVPTEYRVLVLFGAAQGEEGTDDSEEPARSVRFYAVMDEFDLDDEDVGDNEKPEPEAQTQLEAQAAAAPASRDDLDEEEEEDLSEAPETENTESGQEDLQALPPADEPRTDTPDDAAVSKEPETAPAEQEPRDVRLQAYDRAGVPDAIDTAIDYALNEWKEADNKTFSRAGSRNKYSYWRCGKGPKCNIGWCAAFIGYVFDNCDIPMEEYEKSVPHEGGVPYSVREAGVGKLYTGFEKMQRLTVTGRPDDKEEHVAEAPRPGWLVVYGEYQRKKLTYAYKHVGLITDVDDLGQGRYLIKTVEGNMSSRIKRYCYIYDENEKIKNDLPCPEEYRLKDTGINSYEHIKQWRITAFLKTWY